MINRAIIMGRITNDLELKYSPSGFSVMTFSVAVERNYADQNGERQSDFIRCVAWRQTAEFIAKYFGKGRMIALEGALRTRTFDDKNGTRHYITELYVNDVSFTGEPKQQSNTNHRNSYDSGGYQNNPPQNSNGNQPNGYQQSTPPQNQNNVLANDALSIGDLSDFEEIISDGSVPF